MIYDAQISATESKDCSGRCGFRTKSCASWLDKSRVSSRWTSRSRESKTPTISDGVGAGALACLVRLGSDHLVLEDSGGRYPTPLTKGRLNKSHAILGYAVLTPLTSWRPDIHRTTPTPRQTDKKLSHTTPPQSYCLGEWTRFRLRLANARPLVPKRSSATHFHLKPGSRSPALGYEGYYPSSSLALAPLVRQPTARN